MFRARGLWRLSLRFGNGEFTIDDITVIIAKCPRQYNNYKHGNVVA